MSQAIEKQKTEAVYLTSGICENTDHVSPEDMIALGLPFGLTKLITRKGKQYWTTRTAERLEQLTESPEDTLYYPLTCEENNFIGDDTLNMPSGYSALMGYSVLYQGRKWAMPTVEYSWEGDGKDEAESAWQSLLSDATPLIPKIEQAGGGVDMARFAYDDRHELNIRLPMDRLVERFYAPLKASRRTIRHGDVFRAYKKWLASLLT